MLHIFLQFIRQTIISYKLSDKSIYKNHKLFDFNIYKAWKQWKYNKDSFYIYIGLALTLELKEYHMIIVPSKLSLGMIVRIQVAIVYYPYISHCVTIDLDSIAYNVNNLTALREKNLFSVIECVVLGRPVVFGWTDAVLHRT